MDIIVFQQNGSAEKKTAGIRKYATGIVIKKIFSLDGTFPEIIDFPMEYVPESFDGDLVLNFLKHPDLSDYLVELCEEKNIPVVTTGKPGKGFTPFTCCGLGRNQKLGDYGKQFGFPAYAVEVRDERIADIRILRGAPCGATWAAIVDIIGMRVEEALTRLPLQVEQNCFADPSGFDPISGKSPVHYAGNVHHAALKKALEEARQRDEDRNKS